MKDHKKVLQLPDLKSFDYMLDQWTVMKNPNITPIVPSLKSLQTIGIHALTQMVTTPGAHVIPTTSIRLNTPLEPNIRGPCTVSYSI